MADIEKKTTDLSQMFKQKDHNFVDDTTNSSKTSFSFTGLKRKQKIEIIIFIIILAVFIWLLIYFFGSSAA